MLETIKTYHNLTSSLVFFSTCHFATNSVSCQTALWNYTIKFSEESQRSIRRIETYNYYTYLLVNLNVDQSELVFEGVLWWRLVWKLWKPLLQQLFPSSQNKFKFKIRLNKNVVAVVVVWILHFIFIFLQ